MTIYSCEADLVSMLTCIYVAWASGLGHRNVELRLEPIEQYTLFDEYVHVDADYQKAQSVTDSVKRKISPYFYSQLSYNAMSYEADVLDNMYRVMILGFAYGPEVLKRYEFRDIMRFSEIHTRLGKEACHFKEFLRFHQIREDLYIAHVEPKSRIIWALSEDFTDRMPSENWMIVDDTHKIAAVHQKNEESYFQKLSEDEYDRLLLTEKQNDEFTDLWKLFFETIAIKERANAKCQRNLFPVWKRKHAVEFM